MATNSEFVAVGKPAITGAIWSAPVGTALPTKTSEQLNAAFKCLGYCGDSGLENDNTASTQKIKAWGGDVVAESQTEKPDEFKYTLLEVLNEEVLKNVYGATHVTVGSDSEIHVEATSEEAEERSYVIDMILHGKKKRIVIEKGKITSVGTVSYKDDDAVGYPITLAAMYVNGKSHDEYIEG